MTPLPSAHPSAAAAQAVEEEQPSPPRRRENRGGDDRRPQRVASIAAERGGEDRGGGERPVGTWEERERAGRDRGGRAPTSTVSMGPERSRGEGRPRRAETQNAQADSGRGLSPPRARARAEGYAASTPELPAKVCGCPKPQTPLCCAFACPSIRVKDGVTRAQARTIIEKPKRDPERTPSVISSPQRTQQQRMDDRGFLVRDW